MPFGRWGTVAEAARHFGVTRQSIHKTIERGGFDSLDGRRMPRRVTMPRGTVWLIPYPFERRELRNGRPPKGAGKENGE